MKEKIIQMNKNAFQILKIIIMHIFFLHLFLQVWSSIGFYPKQLKFHSRHIFINACIHWESSEHQWNLKPKS